MTKGKSRPWDDMLHEDGDLLDVAMIALRRIRSLGEKNVPRYAQQIAQEALRDLEPHYVRKR